MPMLDLRKVLHRLFERTSGCDRFQRKGQREGPSTPTGGPTCRKRLALAASLPVGLVVSLGLCLGAQPAAKEAPEGKQLAAALQEWSQLSPAQRADLQRTVFEKLGEALPVVREALCSPDTASKPFSIWVVAKVRDHSAENCVLLATTSEDLSVRLQAILALRSVGGSRALQVLRTRLEKRTDDPITLRALALSLGALGTEEEVPLLKSYLADPDPLVRVFAAGSLGQLDNTEGLEALIKGTRSEDSQIRSESILALGYLKDARAEGILRGLLTDPAAEWKTHIRLALARQSLVRLEGDDWFAKAAELARDRNERVATWAITQVGARSGLRPAEILEEAARGIGRRALEAKWQLAARKVAR